MRDEEGRHLGTLDCSICTAFGLNVIWENFAERELLASGMPKNRQCRWFKSSAPNPSWKYFHPSDESLRETRHIWPEEQMFVCVYICLSALLLGIGDCFSAEINIASSHTHSLYLQFSLLLFRFGKPVLLAGKARQTRRALEGPGQDAGSGCSPAQHRHLPALRGAALALGAVPDGARWLMCPVGGPPSRGSRSCVYIIHGASGSTCVKVSLNSKEVVTVVWNV